jgi:site-specific recombinase XerD
MTKSSANSDFLQCMDKGPLGCILPVFAALISQQGFSKHSIQLQLRFLNDMNQWLHQQRMQATDFSEQAIHRYMRSRHQRFRPRRDDAAILNRLVRSRPLTKGRYTTP